MNTIAERHDNLLAAGSALTDSERELVRRIREHVERDWMRGADGLLHPRRVPLAVTDTPARHDADARAQTGRRGPGDARYSLRRDGME